MHQGKCDVRVRLFKEDQSILLVNKEEYRQLRGSEIDKKLERSKSFEVPKRTQDMIKDMNKHS